MRLCSDNKGPGHKRWLQPVLLACLGGAATSVSAIDFQFGEVTGSINSTISYGISQRVEGRDADLVSPGNGGSSRPVTKSNTADDGNLNYDSGDTFSNIIKGVHDIGVNYRNLGGFVRVKWWHDFELSDGKVPHGHEPTSATPGQELNDSGFNDLAKFSGLEVLDAFVYGEFELGDNPLDLRLGRQVVNWGESTFIQGGINTINPIDVSAFRRPGAEIKEGLLPVNMVYANLGLTDNLNIEAFYQLTWEETVIDGCGTYFSTADFVAEGCNRLAFAASIPDQFNYLPLPGVPTPVNRISDREANDGGQFGLALRYYADSLDTEFGGYYMQYHSRMPFISGVKTSDGLPQLHPLGAGDATYFIDYPEDIQLFGLSAATNIGATAVSGEISYRKDLPLQINGNELLTAVLTGAPSSFLPNWLAAPNGSVVEGWDPYDVTQAQVTAVHFFERVLGASRLTLVGEAGMTYVHDLPSLSTQRYGRSTIFGTGSLDPTAYPKDGYVTDTAWGYRAVARLNYNNVFAGVNVSPQISWKHDVDGVSPTPEFNEGRQALGLGVTMSYKETYKLDLSYTNFLDNGDFDVTRDRDFVSLSASVTF